MLIHAEGLFRLDVTVAGDTVRTVVRNLSSGELQTSGPATAPGGPSFGQGEVAAYQPGRVEFEFALGSGEDRVSVTGVIATLRFQQRGTVRVTAQAIVQHAPLR